MTHVRMGSPHSQNVLTMHVENGVSCLHQHSNMLLFLEVLQSQHPSKGHLTLLKLVASLLIKGGMEPSLRNQIVRFYDKNLDYRT